MKALIIIFSAACAVVAYYFGLRNFNESGAIRAGVFVRFHPSKSEQGLLMYSESLVGSTDPDESRSMMFRLKSSVGWRR